VSKKRKAGKKGDDSEDSSSEDDEDDSSSSSSEDEPEVVAKMPVKKRGKVTPTTPRADSGDESSEFEDEHDVDFFKGTEDRQWMMSLTELDRQQIISERRETHEVAREAWEIQHSKKKTGELAPAPSASKGKEMKEPSTPLPPTPSLARGRRDKEKPSDKNAEKRAALEDMAARKDEQQKKGARADVMEEDDDDSPRKRQPERPGRKDVVSAKPRHRQIPQEEHYPRLEKRQLEAARVSRSRLVEYALCPFFGEFVQELYVRVSLGEDTGGLQKYLVCQVIGVKDKQTEYQVTGPDGKPMTLRKHLTVSHAGQKKSYQIGTISNKAFEEHEVSKWCKDMHKENEKLPDEDTLSELKAKLGRNWKEEFVYDEDMVQTILEDKQKSPTRRLQGCGQCDSHQIRS